jgi:DNA-binding NarL/FixJ family response regulator
MKNKDHWNLLHAHSLIIDSAPKIGKFTFLLYLLTTLYKKKALILTPQEGYLFQKRMNALSTQYSQFSNLEEILSPLYLKQEWYTLKQKFGYEFFIQEVENILINVEEEIIVFHKFDDFFGYQDRYDIEAVYKAIVKTASINNKRVIFLTNNQHENHEFIQKTAQEFTDMAISIKTNEKNHRLISIKNILHNQEYPLLKFEITQNAFLLGYADDLEKQATDEIHNILITELDSGSNHIKTICNFIFQKQNIHLKYADSLKTILQEIFIRPDMIVLFMKRTQENLETIKAIKTQLPDTPIIVILDQDFIRAEDFQEAYLYGCDELFAHDLKLERLVLAFQKASNSTFYTDAIHTLPKLDNNLKSIKEISSLANKCIEKSIFFSLFIFHKEENNHEQYSVNRKYDFIFIDKHKIFYLALNTVPNDVTFIEKRLKKCKLICTWEPTNDSNIEECLNA